MNKDVYLRARVAGGDGVGNSQRSFLALSGTSASDILELLSNLVWRQKGVFQSNGFTVDHPYYKTTHLLILELLHQAIIGSDGLTSLHVTLSNTVLRVLHLYLLEPLDRLVQRNIFGSDSWTSFDVSLYDPGFDVFQVFHVGSGVASRYGVLGSCRGGLIGRRVSSPRRKSRRSSSLRMQLTALLCQQPRVMNQRTSIVLTWGMTSGEARASMQAARAETGPLPSRLKVVVTASLSLYRSVRRCTDLVSTALSINQAPNYKQGLRQDRHASGTVLRRIHLTFV